MPRSLTPEDRAVLAEFVKRGLTPGRPKPVESFRDYVTRVRPGYDWYRHCEILISVLQRVADGELKRVLVFAPPQHGKSETVSRLFPAYWLRRNPDKFVGLCSYGADIAHDLSRDARQFYIDSGGVLQEDATAVSRWLTPQKGGLWAAGVGGPITSKGFTLGILDDPVKDDEAAASPLIRERHKQWWLSTFSTRKRLNNAIVIVSTRWNEDDLCGWLLATEAARKTHFERWHIVNLQAIKDEEEFEFPPTCTVEPDWRQLGEALCPELHPLEELEQARDESPYWWNALYQQRPRPLEGGMFKVDKITIVDAVPAGSRRVRWWDKAATATGKGAFTVGVLMARGPDGRFYVEHVKRGRWDVADRENVILQTAKLDGHTVAIWMEQEPGSGGKESAQYTVRSLAGYVVHAETSTGSKEIRADGYASQVSGGNVSLLQDTYDERWNRDYLAELRDFPHGRFADQVDASSGAFNKLAVSRAQGPNVVGGKRQFASLQLR